MGQGMLLRSSGRPNIRPSSGNFCVVNRPEFVRDCKRVWRYAGNYHFGTGAAAAPVSGAGCEQNIVPREPNHSMTKNHRDHQLLALKARLASTYNQVDFLIGRDPKRWRTLHFRRRARETPRLPTHRTGQQAQTARRPRRPGWCQGAQSAAPRRVQQAVVRLASVGD
jgi:hypothetical protein